MPVNSGTRQKRTEAFASVHGVRCPAFYPLSVIVIIAVEYGSLMNLFKCKLLAADSQRKGTVAKDDALIRDYRFICLAAA